MKPKKIDPSMLLGYRLAVAEAEANGMDRDAALAHLCGAKTGAKDGVKVGAKIGAKPGVKPTAPS